MPAILDSGTSEVCLIPKSVAEDAMRNSDIKIEVLDPPVKLRLGDNETEIEATEAITVVIRLKTKVGELITRKRRCLIWDVPSDEIILGGDFLKQLGIDPESALETLIIDNQSNGSGFEDAAGGIEDQKLEGRQDLCLNKTQIFEKYDDIVIGEVIPEEIQSSLEELIADAAKNGLPKDWQNKLRNLIKKYSSVWRKSLGPDLPAKVTPFKTQLKPNAKPFRSKARRYNTEDSEFLKRFVDELLKYGLVKENYNSEWASPVLVVKKSDGGRRMTVDLRGVNALCESTVWPMPFMEAIVKLFSWIEVLV